MLHFLVVEDNRIQARVLRHHLQELGYGLTGVVETAADALTLFDREAPDGLLLDIHLRDTPDGIELARQLLARRPVPLIFLTSDPQQSTFERALTVGPYAFLQKPYDPALLARSIELAVSLFARTYGGADAALTDGSTLVPGALYVRSGNRMIKVFFSEVRWMEADNNYVHIHTLQRKYTIKISLRELETRLPSALFFQIRRNVIVRLSAITQLELSANLVYIDETPLPIGQHYRAALLDQLNYL